MNKLTTQLLIALMATLYIFSGHAAAHDGHDHSHDLSWLVHLIWAVSILAVGIVGLVLIRARMHSQLKKLDSNDAL